MASSPPESNDRIIQAHLDYGARRHGDQDSDLDILVREAIRAMEDKEPTIAEAADRLARTGVSLIGFETDPDFSGLLEFLLDCFGEDLIYRCLIDRIEYQPDRIALLVGRRRFFLDRTEYDQWKAALPDVGQFKLRAHNAHRINSHQLWRYVACPIFLYSFHDEHPETLDYLAGRPDNDLMRRYKLGVVAHEIGHCLHFLHLDQGAKEDWFDLLQEMTPLTDYFRRYLTGIHQADLESMAEEAFAEAVRLAVTAPVFFRDRFAPADRFIKATFPEISPLPGD